MKKMISFILAAAMSAMVAVPAFAAAPEADTVRDGENAKTWTTSGKHDDFKDKMMTMIAYAPNENGEITVDSIQYIDQTTADASGAYSFDSYMPKVLPTAGDYTVKVGSEARDSAVDAGIIEQIAVSEVPITGTIKTQNNAATATVSFCQPGTTESIVSAETIEDVFTVNVAPGTYDVIVSRVGYLKYTITNVVISESFELGSFELEAGDVDGNGSVTGSDIGDVVLGIAKSTGQAGYKEAADFDANGTITASDLGAVVLTIAHTDKTVDFADINK